MHSGRYRAVRFCPGRRANAVRKGGKGKGEGRSVKGERLTRGGYLGDRSIGYGRMRSVELGRGRLEHSGARVFQKRGSDGGKCRFSRVGGNEDTRAGVGCNRGLCFDASSRSELIAIAIGINIGLTRSKHDEHARYKFLHSGNNNEILFYFTI